MKIKCLFLLLATSLILIVSCSSYRSLGDRIDDNLLVPSISRELEKTNPAFADKTKNIARKFFAALLIIFKVLTKLFRCFNRIIFGRSFS